MCQHHLGFSKFGQKSAFKSSFSFHKNWEVIFSLVFSMLFCFIMMCACFRLKPVASVMQFIEKINNK